MLRDSERPPLISKEAVLSILAGMILGPLAYYFDLSRSIFSYFAILVHELGHSFTCWIFGFFSVPAFDFTYGGGRAPMNIDHRYFFLVALVYLFFAWLIWLNRKSPFGIVTVVIFILVYSVMSFSKYFEVTIYFMGHGGELLIAGIFFYRALSGRSIVEGIERPLYATIAFFLEARAFMFGINLLTDPVERTIYTEGLTVGGDTNDFVMISQDLGCSLNTVIFFYLLLALLPPVIAFLIHLLKHWNFISEDAE